MEPDPRYRKSAVNLPARATRDGFDTIYVRAKTGGDRACSVGHFLLDGYAQTDNELQQHVAARDKRRRPRPSLRLSP